MARPIDTLPAEYRTQSLESLPGDLQAIAVSLVQKKFGLEAPKEEEKITLDSMYRNISQLMRDSIIDPYMHMRRIVVEWTYRPASFHGIKQIDMDERDYMDGYRRDHLIVRQILNDDHLLGQLHFGSWPINTSDIVYRILS